MGKQPPKKGKPTPNKDPRSFDNIWTGPDSEDPAVLKAQKDKAKMDSALQVRKKAANEQFQKAVESFKRTKEQAVENYKKNKKQ
jgi:hypothetical protein